MLAAFASRLLATFKSKCADLSCFIVFELFSSTCIGASELPPDPSGGPQALINSRHMAGNSKPESRLNLFIGTSLRVSNTQWNRIEVYQQNSTTRHSTILNPPLCYTDK